MLRTKIAEEYKQDEVIVTYDLAIAKMAYQIQLMDAPKFNNVFINLGAFHIKMALLKPLERYC